jgi:hypothetical protein
LPGICTLKVSWDSLLETQQKNWSEEISENRDGICCAGMGDILEASFAHALDSDSVFDTKQLACPKFSSHKVPPLRPSCIRPCLHSLSAVGW